MIFEIGILAFCSVVCICVTAIVCFDHKGNKKEAEKYFEGKLAVSQDRVAELWKENAELEQKLKKEKP